ncbi:hypothetical protein D3C72_2086270 [compost metagenome]
MIGNLAQLGPTNPRKCLTRRPPNNHIHMFCCTPLVPEHGQKIFWLGLRDVFRLCMHFEQFMGNIRHEVDRMRSSRVGIKFHSPDGTKAYCIKPQRKSATACKKI